MSEKPKETVDSTVKDLEKELGIREGFLRGLNQEDDWSFVIKAHAFIEAAMTHLVTASINKPALVEIFSRMELSDKRTGKAAFAEALGILEKPERRFLAAFSELRNVLVHNVANVDFKFESYFAGLNSEQSKNFLGAYSYFATGETFVDRGKIHNTADFVRKYPRTAAYYSVMVFVSVIRIRNQSRGIEVLLEVFKRRAAEMEEESARQVSLQKSDAQVIPLTNNIEPAPNHTQERTAAGEE